jgi:N-acetylglucosaminyldiphosphoundecaprenol N-acetyl-beta-D-mannosaminyltransferase
LNLIKSKKRKIILKMKKDQKMTPSLDQKYAQIFNIGLNSTSMAQVLRFLRYRISEAEKFFIITVNPEMIDWAEKDEKYAQILNSADLSLPDGVGLLAANKFLAVPDIRPKILAFPYLFLKWLIYFYIYTFRERKLEDGLTLVKGRKLFEEMIKLANKKGWRVFFLGGEGDEAKEAANKLELSYKKIKIRTLRGPMLDSEANPISEKDKELETEAVKIINNFKPQVLFVAFRVPRQGKWICKWFSKLNIGGAMTVGGTFRYISGQAKLPPKWMEEWGLEWLWRLLTEPWRFKRILTAVFVFPLRIIIFRLRNSK